jgi:hypothetical protein
MAGRRFPQPWSDEDLDACFVAVQDTTNTSEWIGSVLLFALATLIILANSCFWVPLNTHQLAISIGRFGGRALRPCSPATPEAPVELNLRPGPLCLATNSAHGAPCDALVTSCLLCNARSNSVNIRQIAIAKLPNSAENLLRGTVPWPHTSRALGSGLGGILLAVLATLLILAALFGWL